MKQRSVVELDRFFNPKSVAVVGATNNIVKAGNAIIKNLIINKKRGLFRGEVFPVNPNESRILDFPCYSSLKAIPISPELVVIAVPANIVPQIMKDAATKKSKAVIIFSSGFGEIGNQKLENQVVKIAKDAGMRVLGPNCVGVYDAKTGVDSLFLPETKVLISGKEVVATPRPMPGNIAIVTQSGAFGIAALDYLAGRQIGTSKLVSFGNKCDVDETEMLNYLSYDDETKVILLYLEDVKHGRQFFRVAKDVTLEKPVVVLKTGRNVAGVRAAASHTGAIAGSDKIYDGVFKQTGIIRAENMEDLFDCGKALAMQPPTTGKNIGIITDAGGPGIMAVDECELRGLTVNRFSSETLEKLEDLKEREKLPKFATNLNPIDITGSGTAETFEQVTKILFEDPDIHGIILIGLHHQPGLQEDFIDRIAEVADNYCKPIVACDIGETEMALYSRFRFDRLGIPSYFSPEGTARAMKALASYGTYLKRNDCFESYVRNFVEKRHSNLAVKQA